ncbi:restriction endonuclease [Arthrobacter sp. 35/47]|uniref:restriction endonuclease n=1 Tax=Arthrobacter sp. 35/47 TaxID=269454 RepID=UPI00047E5CB8|nr:restriction endonuclease [Arthrobacter sp. 35/47]
MTKPVTDSETTEVPIWPALLAPVLEVLSDGKRYHRRELFSRAADVAGLSETARSERLKKGNLRYEQRMGWVLSHLMRAGLLDRPTRGEYEINDAGRVWHAEHPNGMDYSQAHAYFAPFWPKTVKASSGPTQQPTETLIEDLDPVEQIENSVDKIHAKVGDELLQRLRDSHPASFEQTVVDLLLKMGYGGAEQRGKRIGGTGDGGVDGVIDQDALGLDQIYIQAKRYKLGSNVGRETIQAFVGALHGAGASRGVFITTSSFTDHARTYAAGIPSRVILIDSVRLVNLMIKYRVGVQVKQTYDVVDLDEDYFE